MLTLLALLSMAVALAAFFAVMLWLDPKRRQYAAATAVAVGAVGLADAVPATGGVAWAQDRPPEEIIVPGDMPSNCERRDDGQVHCDDGDVFDLAAFCNEFGSMFAESFCYGAISGGGSSGGSGGSGSGGGNGGNLSTYIPPMPDCPCGQATWENGNSGEAYGAAIGGYWQCPSIVPCVPEETRVDYLIPAACVAVISGLPGVICGARAGPVGAVSCSIAAGILDNIYNICPSIGRGDQHR